MNRAQIRKTREDAQRVVELCGQAETELVQVGFQGYIYGTKTSGALRRASLDLTRSLAEMRKP